MAQALAGSEWRPLRIGATTISDRGAPFVQFKAEGVLLVSSGCAYLSGSYRIAGSQIQVSLGDPPGAACEGTRAQIQAMLIGALRAARRFERHRAKLVLRDAEDSFIADFAQTDWD